jgi:NAD(P)-dependent dehydrogenase (short-subunit alcohol dehydrogenase family)
MSDIRFDGRVAIVTGAGNGLGRSYALELARRGASVVVNDLGGDTAGSGASATAAQRVVADIEGRGGIAVANADSVATEEGGANIVKSALEAFGGVDVIVNNAGILRNQDFESMTREDFEAVIDTHLWGAINVSQPAYRVMRQRGYGRFVFTTSSAGLFGIRGEANYAAAKASVIGLMNSIRTEGSAHGIRANAVAPVAVTRIAAGMRHDNTPPDDAARAAVRPTLELPMTADFVTPLVVVLASQECSVTGQIFSAVGGRFARVFIGVTPGWYGPKDAPASAEELLDHWEEISSRDGYAIPTSTFDEIGYVREQAPG